MMKRLCEVGSGVALLASIFVVPAMASEDTVSVNGINSANLGLTGSGISVGLVEYERPGDPDINDNGMSFETGIDDDGSHSNFTTDPKAVFIENGLPPTPNSDEEIISDEGPPPAPYSHATEVAGVVISTDPVATGVAPEADLYASAGGQNTAVIPIMDKLALSAQHVALQDGGDVRGINFSFIIPFESGNSFDGNSKLTQFVDWSSSVHDVLYVQGGYEINKPPGLAQPTDNFNGIKVGASEKPFGEAVYRQVSDINVFNQHPDSSRTLIDIIAPGEEIHAAALGAPQPPLRRGTSYAAPHVTGTVALLQEYGEDQYPSAGWDDDFRRHEVMKAVLMNSADKIEEGTAPPPGHLDIPDGGLLGMERTVVKQDGMSTWFDSDAYSDATFSTGQLIPLDEEMGTGHLNANRAFTQFSAGEQNHEDGDVPVIGWDYGTTTGAGINNRYRFEEPLEAGSFVSITVAWDRAVDLDIDNGTMGEFDAGDTFEDYQDNIGDPQADSVINDLDLYFLPRDSMAIGEAEGSSFSPEGTVEHIFFQVPFDGEWEFWVHQNDQETEVGRTQDYAVAWWAMSTNAPQLSGDFDGDNDVDGEDLAEWQTNFGPSTGADADDDGDSDGEDFLVWQRNVGVTATTAAANAAPEPAAWLLGTVGLPLVLRRRRAL